MATDARYRLAWKRGEKNLLLVSLGTGAAATPTFKTKMNLASNALGLPGHLMYAVQVDQDINCRTVGRCTYGSMIDRELLDLTCRLAPDTSTREEWLGSAHRPLTEDLGRAFLYARYNADLSREGLKALGCPDIEPDDVQQMDSVEHMDELLRVGRAAGQQISLNHFGPFV